MRLARLPGPGGLGDQDAWLMQALDVIADETNAMLREQWERTTGDG